MEVYGHARRAITHKHTVPRFAKKFEKEINAEEAINAVRFIERFEVKEQE